MKNTKDPILKPASPTALTKAKRRIIHPYLQFKPGRRNKKLIPAITKNEFRGLERCIYGFFYLRREGASSLLFHYNA